MAKNSNCVISDSPVCKWLDKECTHCYVNSIKDDADKEKVMQDFEVMLSLLPNDIDELQGETCAFCVEQPRKRDGYAIIDLAHNEPEHKKGMFFGFGKKVRQRIGSLMPMSISICKRCRRNFRMIENVKWLSIIVFVAIAIGLMFIPAVKNMIGSADSPLSYAVILVGGVIGYVIGKAVSAAYIKAKKKETRFNVFDIPICSKMREIGWFTVQDETEVTKFILSRKSVVKKIGELKNDVKKDDAEFTQTSFLEH